MIKLTVADRTIVARAFIQVDQDSFLVDCKLENAGHVTPVRTTAELYADLLGVRRQHYILTMGDVVLTVAEPGSLYRVEWRAGPAVLRRGSTPRPTAHPVAMLISAPWDENGRANVPADVSGVFDPADRSLLLHHGEEVAHWISPAEGLDLGLSAPGQLAAFYFHALPLDLSDLVGSR